MDKPEQVKELRKDFELLQIGLSAQSVSEIIGTLVRRLSRWKTGDNTLDFQLKKISADIMKTYTSEVEYQELKNKAVNPGLRVKPEFEESFFQSLAILKSELFTLLEKL